MILPKVTPEIQAGSLLTPLVMVIGLTVWAVTHAGTADEAAIAAKEAVTEARSASVKSDAQNDALRKDMVLGFEHVRSEMANGFDKAGAAFANFPDVRARQVEEERRLADLELHMRQDEGDLNGLLRSAGQPTRTPR